MARALRNHSLYTELTCHPSSVCKANLNIILRRSARNVLDGASGSPNPTVGSQSWSGLRDYSTTVYRISF